MQIPNIFTSFSPKFLLTIFLVKSKLSTAKKSKTTTFSRVFHPKKIDNFLGKSKLNFWTKKWRFRTVCQFIYFDFILTKFYSSFCSQFSGDWSVPSNYSYGWKRKTIYRLWSSHEDQFTDFQVITQFQYSKAHLT